MCAKVKNHFIHSFLHELNQTSRLCRLFGELTFEKVCSSELSFEEFIILDTIACNQGICQTDLANILLKGKSHISKLLMKLSTKGYIERPLDTKGNRIVRKITFTPEGEKIYSETEAKMQDLINLLEKEIPSKDIETAKRIFNKLTALINSTGKIKLD